MEYVQAPHLCYGTAFSTSRSVICDKGDSVLLKIHKISREFLQTHPDSHGKSASNILF